jgi:hypothetical protein
MLRPVAAALLLRLTIDNEAPEALPVSVDVALTVLVRPRLKIPPGPLPATALVALRVPTAIRAPNKAPVTNFLLMRAPPQVTP